MELDIFKTLLAGGNLIAVLLFYLYLEERKERRALQSERKDEMMEGLKKDIQIIETLKELKQSLERKG